jgi:hypothetical protein
VSHPSPDRQPLLAQFAALAAAIFVGASAALAVHRLLAPTSPPAAVELPAAVAPSAPADSRVAEALIELARELRETRAILETLSADPQRTSVAVPGEPSLDSLASVLRSLEASLAARGSDDGRAPAALRPPQEQHRAWLPPVPADTPDRDRFRTRQHLFWTEQQILDRYGKPDEVNVNNDVSYWDYKDESEGDDHRGFQVVFHRGQVIRVEGP